MQIKPKQLIISLSMNKHFHIFIGIYFNHLFLSNKYYVVRLEAEKIDFNPLWHNFIFQLIRIILI